MSNTTATAANIKVGRGLAVHAPEFANSGAFAGIACGTATGFRNGGMRKTAAPVTCKVCLAKS